MNQAFDSSNALPPVIFLMGPTASGKSALAVALAQRLNAEIISVDSALVYRGMDIGVAKPTLAERGGIVHHLLDILDPSESFSTGQFRKTALELMHDIGARGKLPILVGGTMLYFNSLNHGLAELPVADPAVRAALDQDFLKLGKEAMHQHLADCDPESAARIHPNDPQRVQRALEVFMLTGQTLTQYFQTTNTAPIPFNIIKLIIAPSDRKQLHDIIAKRFLNMLERGLVEEVRTLYQRGDLNLSLPSMRAVGYRQVWEYLEGKESYAGMTEKAIIATRQLAKRQFTWLRREVDAQNFVSGSDMMLENVLRHLEPRLTLA